jgi:hypothetical protein
MVILWIASALAGSDTWTLAQDTWFMDQPVVIERPVAQWALEGGYVFQIEDRGEPIGVVWVGDATWNVHFETEREARVTANRLAVLEHVDPASLVNLYDKGLSLPSDRGIFIGRSLWAEFQPSLVRIDDDAVQLDGEIEEVLVTGYRSPGAARRLAGRTLDERMDWLRTHRFDPAGLLEVEGLQAHPQPATFAELHTEQTWDRFAGADTAGANERWLSYTHDPSGVLDPQIASHTFAAHASDNQPASSRTLVRRLHPTDQRGERRARRRLDIVSAQATHVFDPQPAAYTTRTYSAAEVTLVAKGGPAEVAWIDVPHIHQQPWAGEPPLPHSWELVRVAVNGEPVKVHHLPMSPDQIEGRGRTRTLAVPIPTLAPGETVEILLEWSDLHRYAHMLQFATAPSGFGAPGSSSEVRNLGYATDVLHALPTVRTNRAHARPLTLRVGVPLEKSRRNRALFAAERIRHWEDAEMAWSQGETTTLAPTLALGQWNIQNHDSAAGAPAIQVALLDRSGPKHAEVAEQARQLLVLFEQILPELPTDQLHIAQSVAEYRHLEIGAAGNGMLWFGSAQLAMPRAGIESRIRRVFPHAEQYMLATTLHAQWWMARRDTSRSLLLASALGYGVSALEALHGPEVGKDWRFTMREFAEISTGRIGPLTEPNYSWAGALVLLDVLPSQLGLHNVRGAIDDVLDGAYPATWEGLEHALVARGATHAPEVFDTWVHTGIAPRVELDWTVSDGSLRIRATSNLPFGTLTVPVRAVRSDQAADLWMTLTDGRGEGAIPWNGDPPRKIQIDPDDTLLLRR